ncbi:FAD-binding oxidoreductase [Oceanicella sp. SM1341]|uniref:NAD(P)/FAD-dependent oxidoreductase n=1 Tax=Oceanicella sp. SM1341 TaxID=1548889 RepID=UPI000E4D5598|nr:FAD-dependent oxidoreductase [Oceanicella sp. SM1341]
MHVAVIGAGIVGVCSAAWLQRDGHEVTIIDPLEAGEACSFGNAGSLSPSACLPVGMPGMWKKVPGWLLDPAGPLTIRPSYLPSVAPWLIRFLRASRRGEVERIATAMRGLLGPVFEAYTPLLQRAGAMGLMRRTGCLYVYSSRETAQQWRWGMDLRRALGVELRDVDREELEALEPDLKGRFRFGILAPENGSAADPSALVKAIHARCIADGASHLKQRVTGFAMRDGAVAQVRLAGDAPLDVDAVVIAAGAWSALLTRAVGLSVPLESQRGYHVTVQSTNLALRHTVMASEHNLMVNPMDVGLRLAGTVELAGLNAPPDYARADMLLARGRELFPHLDTSRVTRWMGHRPCLPDSMPVIGRAPRAENVFLGFGHGHVGMCGGATTGREIAALVSGRSPEVDLAPFSPERFRPGRRGATAPRSGAAA